MPDYARSRSGYTAGGVDVYATVGGWWNDTQVPYIAHAISRDGTVTRLRDTLSLGASNSPDHHPDQQYWKLEQKNKPPKAVQGIVDGLATAGNQGGIARIEIDCKLMPCYNKASYTKCMYQVPALIFKLYGLDGTTLWIFSHANENMGGAHSSSKRRIICKVNASNADLEKAYDAHDGWGWTA